MHTVVSSKLRFRRLVLFCVILLGASLPAWAQTGWYDENWAFRQPVTISSSATTADLTDFPYLVTLGAGNSLFTAARSDGRDILFTAGDGTTKLPHEFETYNAGPDTLEAWVKIPTLTSGSDTTIYVYYGNAGASDQQNSTGVWDDNFEFVMHLNEDVVDDQSGALHADSTVNGYTGVQAKNEGVANGRFNGSQLFERANFPEAINMGQVYSDEWTAITIESWIRRDADDDSRIVAKAFGTTTGQAIFMMGQSPGNLRARIGTDPGPNVTAANIFIMPAVDNTEWLHVAITWDAATGQIDGYVGYPDGAGGTVATGSDTRAGTSLRDGTDTTDEPGVFIGNYDDTDAADNRVFPGSIDEVRVSRVARSAEWLGATFRNGNDLSDGSFDDVTEGAEEISVSGTVFTGESGGRIGPNRTVSLAVNNGLVGSDTTDSQGDYFITVPTASVADGDRVTVFLDDETEVGSTVAITDGGNLFNIDIYQDRLTVQSETASVTPPTNANLATTPTAPYADADILYTVPSLDNVTVANNVTFHVPPAYSFTQTADLVTQGTGGLRVRGTFNASSAADALTIAGSVTGPGVLTGNSAVVSVTGNMLVSNYSGSSGTTSVGGDWDVGSYTPNNGRVSFTGTGQVAAETFYDLEINSAGTVSAVGSLTVSNSIALTAGIFSPGSFTHQVTGDWNDSGVGVTFVPSAGTIVLTTLDANITAGGTNQFHNLTLQNGALLQSDIYVNGRLRITGGELEAGAWTIELAGEWDNQVGGLGFNAGTGVVVLRDASKEATIRGNTTFNVFQIQSTETDKIVRFEAGSLQTIADLDLVGGTAAGESVSLLSTADGVQWQISVAAVTQADYITVKDSDATPGIVINASNSFDAGNNDGWSITPPAGSTIWDGSGDTTWGNGANWSAGAPVLGDTAAIPPDAARNPTLLADSGGFDALSIASGAGVDTGGFNLSPTNLYNNGVIFRTTAGTVPQDANSGTVVYYGNGGGNNLAAQDYNNLQLVGAGITYTLNAVTTVNGNLSLAPGTFFAGQGAKERSFADGADLALGGNTLLVAGGATVALNRTLDAGTAGLTVSGDLSGAGTLTWNSTSISVGGDLSVDTVADPAAPATLTVAGDWAVTNFAPADADAAVVFDGPGSVSAATFWDLTLNAGSGTRIASGDIVINGNLAIGSGATLNLNGYNLTVAGNITGAGTLIGGSGTVSVTGSLAVANYEATTGSTEVGADWNVSGDFDANGGSVTFTAPSVSTIQQGTTFNNLTITLGTIADTGGNAITIEGTFSNPGTLYRRDADFVSKTDATQGTVEYRASVPASPLVQLYSGVDYNNLVIHNEAQVLTGDAEIAGNLTIGDGASTPNFSINGYTITVNGSWNKLSGTFVANSGRVVLAGPAAATVTGSHTGAQAFYDFVIEEPGKTVQFEAGSTQEIDGLLRLHGSASSLLTLNSTASPTQWNIDATGTRDVQYVSVNDSASITAPNIEAFQSTGTNTTNWTFTGTTFSWESNTTSTWTDAGNWTPAGGPPGADDTAIIQPNNGTTITVQPVLGGPRSLDSLVIEPGAELDMDGNTLTLSGTLDNQGIIRRHLVTSPAAVTLTRTDTDSGLTIYDGGTAGDYLQDYGSTDYYDLQVDIDATLEYAVGTARNFTNNAIFNAASNAITVGGNWINNGTFNNGGAVNVVDATQTTLITGPATLGALNIEVPGKTVQFTDGLANKITTGTLTVSGTSASLIDLESATPTSQWYIDVAPADAAVTYARVTDSHANESTANTVAPTESLAGAGGNNINWNFGTTTLVRTWDGSTSTDWSEPTNWSGDTLPTADSQVTIPNVVAPNVFPILTGDVTVTDLTIDPNAWVDTGGFTLTISGTFENNGRLYRRGGDSVSQTDIDSGVVEYRNTGGSIQRYPGETQDYNELVLTAQTFNLGGDLRVVSNLSGTGTLDGGAVSVSVGGDMLLDNYDATTGTTTVVGTWNVASLTNNGGLVRFTGVGDVSGGAFWDVDVASGTRTLVGDLTVQDDLTVQGGATLQTGALILYVGGDFTNGGIFDAGIGTVVFNGSADQYVDSGGDNFNQLEVDKTGGVLYANSAVTVTGSATLTQGTFNLFNNNLSVGLDLTGAGSVVATGAGAAETVTVSRDFTVGDFTSGNSVVILDTAQVATISGYAFNQLNIAKTAGGNVSFTGSTSTSSAPTINADAYNISITGTTNSFGGTTSFDNSGSLTVGDQATDSTTFVGGVTATAPGSVSLAGTIATGNSNLSIGDGDTATTLGANTTITVGSGNAAFGGTVDNASTLTVNSDGVTTFAGAVGGITPLAGLTTDAGGSTSVNANITTDTGDQTYNDSVDILSAVSLTGTGGAGLTFNNTLDGTVALTLNAAGAIIAVGAVGGAQPPTTLEIAQSNGTTFQSTVDAATVTLTDTADGQTIAFQGDLTATTGMSAAANGPYNVSILGSTNQIAGATTFGNTGTLSLGDGGVGTDAIEFTGGVTATAPSVNLAAGVTTVGSALSLGTTALTANSELDTGNAGTGTISTGAISGGGNTLVLDSGSTAGATMSIGGADNVSTLTIRDAGGVATFTGPVGAGTAGDVTITNSQAGVTFAALTANTVTITDTTGTVSIGGDATINTGLSTANQPYNVSITGAVNSIAGATTLANGGTVTLGDGGDTTEFTGGLTATAPASIAANGTVSTVDAAMALGDAGTAVTLGGPTIIDTGGGTLSLGAVNGATTLSIDTTGGTETGAITFNGALGGGPALTGLTVIGKAGVALPALTTQAVGNLSVTANGGSITDGGALTVVGTTSLTAGANDIVLDNGNDFQGDVTVVSAANAALNDTGALQFGGASSVTTNLTVTAGGAVTQAVGSSIGSGGTADITPGAGTNVTLSETANDFGTFTAATSAAVSVADTNGIILGAIDDGLGGAATTLTVSAAGAITDSGVINLSGTSSFTTTAGGSPITLDSASTYGGALTASANGAGNVDVTGLLTNLLIGTITSGGTVTLTTTGSINDAAANPDTTTDITAPTVDLSAGTGLGNTAHLDLDVDTIDAATTGGAVSIQSNNATATAINTLRTDGAAITFVHNTAAALTVADSEGAGPTREVASGFGGSNGGNITVTATTATLTINGEIDSSSGAGGTLSFNGAVVNEAPTLGQGDITLDGVGDSASFPSPVTFGSTTTVNSNGDIIVSAAVSTSAGDLTLRADADDNGTGGVWIQTAGSVTAAGNGSLVGSSLIDGGASGQAVLVSADGANTQFSSGGTIDILRNVTAAPLPEENIEINGVVAGGGGAFTVNATGSVLLNNGAGDLSSGGGTVTITADSNASLAGGVTIVDGATIDAAGGTITITGYDNVQITGLSSTATAADAVSVTSTNGGIRDGGDSAVDIVANGATARTVLSSVTGIGAVAGGGADAPLETQVTELSATNSVAGAIQIDESDGLTVSRATTINANVTITTTTGSLLVGAAVTPAISAGTGTVSLTATAGAINDAGADVTADIEGDTIVLNADSGIGNTAALELSSGTSVAADSTNGNIDLDHAADAAVTATSLTTGTGNITFDQTGSRTLGVTSATTTDGTIAITNDGATLTASSVSAGGAGQDVTLTTTTGGNVVVGDVSAVDLVTVNAAADIVEAAPTDAASDIGGTSISLTAGTGGTGQIGLATAGDELEIDLGAGTLSLTTAGPGGDIHVAESTGVIALSNVTVVTPGGSVAVVLENNDEGFSADAASWPGGSGADDNITLAALNTTTPGANDNIDFTGGSSIVTSGNVTLDTVTAVSDAAGDAGVDVSAGTLTITSETGVGAAGEALETTVTTLDVQNSTSGAVVVTESDDLTVSRATTVNANVTITTTTGSMLVGAAATPAISAGTGTVSLTATAGAINDAAADATADIEGDTIDLNADTGIGNTAALELSSGTSVAADSANGNIDLYHVADAAVTATSLTTGTGNITFTQTGGQTLGVTSATTGDGSIGISNTGANLTASSVTAGTGAAADGDVTLTTVTSGDVLVDAVTAGGDTVTVNSAAGIEESGADGTADISAATIDLNPANGIGDDAQLELSATALTMDSTAGGENFDVDVLTGGSNVALNSATIGGAAGSITLDVTGGGNLSTGGNVTTANGAIDISVDSGNLNLSGDTVTAGGANGILLDTTIAGDITLGTLDATGDLVTINSIGDIDDDGAGTPDVTAGSVNFDAANGIGATQQIELSAVTLVNADNSGNANVTLTNAATGAVTINSITTGTGVISFTQTGGQTLGVTSATTGDGPITIQADETITAASVVSSTDAEANDIAITATAGNIELGTVNAGTVSGDVALTASAGAVTDTNTDSSVTADNLTIIADTGVGVNFAQPINTTINGITAQSATSGDIAINEANALSTIGVISTAGGGSIRVDAGGVFTVAHNVTTVGGDITLNPVIEVEADIAVGSGAGVGAITIPSIVDNGAGGPFSLTVGAGEGDVTFGSVIGGTAALSGLTISGNDIQLTGIGSGVSGVTGNVSVTSSDAPGPDEGRLFLSGPGTTDDYRSGGAQSYTGGSYGTVFQTSAGGSVQAGGTGVSVTGDLFLDANGVTVTLLSNLDVSGRLVGYRGTWNMSNRTITVGDDLVLFGGAYEPDDLDFVLVDNTRFEYPDLKEATNALTYKPGVAPAGGGYNADATFSVGAPSFAFAGGGLDNTTIDVSGDFYVNGLDLTSAAWTLTVADNSAADPVADPNYLWGQPYAVFLYGTVSNSAVTAGSGSIAAAIVAAGHTNNNVTDGTGNVIWDWNGGTPIPGWDFVAPQISSTAIRKDDVLFVQMSSQVTNVGNAIDDGAPTVSYNGDGLAFDASYQDALLADSTNAAPAVGLDSFFLHTINTRWNTDADGNNASISGTGTDRDGTERATIPDVSWTKGAFHSAGGRNPAINYNRERANDTATQPAPIWSGTTDEAGPVLYLVEYGRAAHNQPASTWYDGHNYFHLYWSEPVDLDGSFNSGNGFDTGAGATAENVRSEISIGAVGGYGGDIQSNGSDILVENYFSYTPVSGSTMTRGARTGSATANGLYRQDTSADGVADPFTDGGPAPRQQNEQQLRIYLSGYNDGVGPADELFPGWHASVPDPSGATVTVESATNVTDDQGNVMDGDIDPPLGLIADPVGVGGEPTAPAAQPGDPWFNYWELDPPQVATNLPAVPNYEILTLDGDANGFVDTLEFHVLDDAGDDGDWVSSGVHPDLKRGIRFNTLIYPGDGLDETLAFRVEEETFTPVTLSAVGPGLGYDSAVDNLLFGTVNTQNDPYFALSFDDSVSGNQWSVLTSIWVSYDHEQAYVTDLAGNLLPSFDEWLAIERTPPRITLALAIAGSDRIYVKFSEAVFGAPDATTDIGAATLALNGASGQTIQSISVISREEESGGVSEAFLELSGNLSANDAVNATIGPATNSSLYDRVGNATSQTAQRRVTDVGLGVVEPVWASDTIHVDETFGSGFESVRVFDGSGQVAPRDITLQARIIASDATSLPLSFIYDIDVPDSVRENLTTPNESPRYWYTSQIPGLVQSNLNTAARVLNPYDSNGALRTFFIQESDPELEYGSQLEFQFRLGSLPAARYTDVNDPREIAPWLLGIQGFIPQRGGVTILNNVINPENGERTVLTYELDRAGMVLIQIFTLDGNLVRNLQRGRQGAGSYNVAWDGTNAGGRIVTPGIYFIRVVAPDIDEYRKVMIVD